MEIIIVIKSHLIWWTVLQHPTQGWWRSALDELPGIIFIGQVCHSFYTATRSLGAIGPRLLAFGHWGRVSQIDDLYTSLVTSSSCPIKLLVTTNNWGWSGILTHFSFSQFLWTDKERILWFGNCERDNEFAWITKENMMSEAARAMMRTWVERSFWGRRSITATTTRFENRLTTTEEMGCQHHIIPTFLKILLYGYLSKSPYPLRQSPTFVRLGGGIICCARRGKLHENLPIKRTYSPTGMFLAGRKMA